ncbi:MAG: FAD-dependent oxidoreductase [Fischerella sp. CENA71]|nr:FAD-dependent oxidoreductase [Fischerella sp. CENA71]
MTFDSNLIIGKSMSKQVVIFGGGVAGMSAAHELVERGFKVAVYEAKTIPGGKSRSIAVPSSGINGNKNLPGEHGFRFFPGFYRHLPDTMKRIPYKNQPHGVFDNLVETTRTLGLTVGKGQWIAPNAFPTSVDDFATAFELLSQMLIGNGLNIPRQESWHFIEKLLVILTSCEERCFAEYEYIPWWDFLNASKCSPEFQKYIASGPTKTLVACRAEEISTRTGGRIGAQLFLDIFRQCSDRVLNGPTNDVWFDPWREYLQQSGVDYRLNAQVKNISCSGKRITGITILENGVEHEVTADYYIAAVPVEVMMRLVTQPMIEAEPRLGLLGKLRTEWMSGIQFYLDRQIPMNHGHTIYLDSPWALTSVSQEQFWPYFNLKEYGDGRVQGIISVCISDWNSPGILYEKVATQCTPEEIKNEVWAQLKAHFSNDIRRDFEEANILNWFLDPAIVYPNPTVATNLEPLLINTAGSWEHRPDAITEIENLFLASDYVRTHTDLATMEGANEAARRAVNGILDASGSNATRCEVWQLDEPAFLAPLKAYDRLRFGAGQPHQLPPFRKIGFGAIRLIQKGLEQLPALSEALVDELQKRQMDQELVGLEWKLASLWSTLRYSWASSNSRIKKPQSASDWSWDYYPESRASENRKPGDKGFASLKILERLSSNQELKGLDFQLRSVRILLEDGMSVLSENFQSYQTIPDPTIVQQVVQQILSLPGKRIRALCVYLSACVGRRSYPVAVDNIALAAEFVHAATLLHDDVIDLAQERRHEPSARVVYGNAASILGGDFLVVQAAQLLLEVGRPELVSELLSVVETMVLSETEQLENRGQLVLDPTTYLSVIKGKTATLFSWSCSAGASASNQPQSVVKALKRYGENFGMAYQLIDDLLDLMGDQTLMGKKLYKDIAEGKMTYPFIIAANADPTIYTELHTILSNPEKLESLEVQLKIKELVMQTQAAEQTRALAATYIEKAIAELEQLPWGIAREALQTLAAVSLERLF